MVFKGAKVNKCKIGDVVQLKSGMGSRMTVQHVYPNGPNVSVLWFDFQGRLEERTIPEAVLDIVPHTPPT